MRTLGGLLVVAGIVGFFYCSSQIGSVPPPPEGVSLAQAVDTLGGRLEIGRYASAIAAVVGVILSAFPKGR